MTDEKPASASNATRVFGAVLVVGGILILIALSVFVGVALNYRASFTGSLPPFGDFAEGMAMLSPVILIALLLIGYGRHLLRKA